MSKFLFKLQPVLNYRTQMEDSVKNEMGKATARLDKEKQLLLGLEQEMEECLLQNTQDMISGASVLRFQQYNAYLTFLNIKMKNQNMNVTAANLEVEHCREKLVKAMQERKMLEKLREIRYTEYCKEEEKDSQKVVDGTVSFNYNNRLAGEDNGRQ